MFEPIPDKTYEEAGRIIRAAESPDGTLLQHESLPNVQLIVAAAAIALERGAPNLLYDAHDQEAQRYLQQGTTEWRLMHQAVARAIEQDRTGRTLFEEQSDLLTHIVSDVVVMAQARKLDFAIRTNDPNIDAGLPAPSLQTVELARRDAGLAAEIKQVSLGLYYNLDPTRQQAVDTDLKLGRLLGPELQRSVRDADGVLFDRAARAGLEEHRRDVDFGPNEPFFEAVRPEFIRRAGELASSPERSDIGRAVSIHVEYRGASNQFAAMTMVSGVDTDDPHALLARARMVQEASLGRTKLAPQEMAARIEADRKVMEAADMELAIAEPGESQRYTDMDLGHIMMGAYHRLDRKHQATISEALDRAEGVSPLASMQMEMISRDIDTRARAPAVEAKRRMAASMGGPSF